MAKTALFKKKNEDDVKHWPRNLFYPKGILIKMPSFLSDTIFSIVRLIASGLYICFSAPILLGRNFISRGLKVLRNKIANFIAMSYMSYALKNTR